MARAKSNGNGRLEEALATLLQNQASFLAQMAERERRMAEIDQRIANLDRVNSERFARIETLLLEHSRVLADHGHILTEHTHILAEHTHLLQALADAIREKIGFKAPGQG